VPTYAAPTLAGDTVRVTAGGPLTLVNVWATWCTSCREEMADLEAMQRDYGPRGLRVVAVSVDEGSVERVRRFVEREKLTMPIAHDPEGRIQRLYSVVGVPRDVPRRARRPPRVEAGRRAARRAEAARRAVEAALD
jgi:peroxiredoxin